MTDLTARIAESRRLLEESTERDNGKTWRVEKVHDLWVELRVGYGFANRMVVDCASKEDAAIILRMRNEYAALLDVVEAAQGVVQMPLDALGPLRAALAAYARAGGAK